VVFHYDFNLVINGIKHLFMYLFAIHISSLMKGMLNYLAHFKNWIVFFLLDSENFSYILHMWPLSDRGCINIFYQSVTCLFFFLTSFEKLFIIKFFIYRFVLLESYSRNLCLTQITKLFSCVSFFYTFSYFYTFSNAFVFYTLSL
jgi:hypothetical protein